MESTNFKLFVEKHSPSFGLLKVNTPFYVILRTVGTKQLFILSAERYWNLWSDLGNYGTKPKQIRRGFSGRRSQVGK